jgi:adenylate cyclase, class 2
MAGHDGNLEVEVKFFVPDLAAVRGLLLAAGAKVVRPRVFERNVRFDTADEALLAEWKLLRLRQDTAVTITFKGDPQQAVASEARVREELEVVVSDFDTMALILTRLGFSPVQSYEKYREAFVWQEVEVVLDELPYGNFVELEGEEAALKTAVSQLGLDWEKRILGNYLSLMQQLQEKHKLPFADLTFANFAGLSASIGDVLDE